MTELTQPRIQAFKHILNPRSQTRIIAGCNSQNMAWKGGKESKILGHIICRCTKIYQVINSILYDK